MRLESNPRRRETIRRLLRSNICPIVLWKPHRLTFILFAGPQTAVPSLDTGTAWAEGRSLLAF